ncbi:MAG: transcriptional regulator [Aphanocapsa feldmannii 277cV]|uniref:Transcriptional regulator n=1 Tax=Aphanocapsa feldmannii 277cV TaxID=2507553 RepID=A0A524RM96_9CHRO|nr:MAG: transcriptional regulator [Aphanocapsa feldmannii 277cV]
MTLQQYDDSELEALMAAGESDLVEFKQAWSKGSASERGREAVCAFANDLANHGKPGVLFVGVADDGSARDLPKQDADQLLQTLTGIKSDGRIVPPPTLQVACRSLGGVDVVVVTVWPADSPPVRFDGRICVRSGPRRGFATSQDERILNEKRRFRDQPFDARPCSSASLEDLDLFWYKENYLPAAVAPEVLEANRRSREEQLASTRMIVSPAEPTPTHLGVLTLSSSPCDCLPCAHVQFLKLAGPTLADEPLDEADIEDRMVDVIRRLEEKLASHNRTAVDFRSGSTEKRTELYPLVAMQQLFRNAVMHRTYEHTNAPIRVTWYADRLDILSPGGPVGIVTAETFGLPGYTDYRNPNLAGFLRETGFAQRFEAGIATARRECERNGNPPPEFEVTDAAIRVTLRPPQGMKEAP